MHFSICMCVSIGWREKWQLACRRRTFRSCQLASPTCDSGEIRTEQEQESERAEGENMAAEDYHFYIKRMLSQQRSRAAPVNCGTAQLLVTPSKGGGGLL